MSLERLNAVLAEIDAVNSQDPNMSIIDGQSQPNELLYGLRMSLTLKDFAPESSELLRIAVRAQHIERWILARNDFPEGRSGYKKWRSQLALHHATRTAEIMNKHRYSEEEIERVKYLLLKRGLKHDDESQCLEDVACLVFLSYYFEEFASKHPKEKLLNILRLTWGKMSEKGHKAALKIKLSKNLQTLVNKAVS